MNKDRTIEYDIADLIMERPQGFKVEGRQFYLYPVTLGKTFLIDRNVEVLELDEQKAKSDPFAEAIRICAEKRNDVCRLLAYHTINDRMQLFDADCIEERSQFFINHLDANELVKLLVVVLTMGNIAPFTKHLGIDDEREKLSKVIKIKSDKSNSLSFGGKSVLGALIVPACEKLNMTPMQVIWEISLPLLKMLMADAVSSVYLTDDERKNAHLPLGGETINADDPNNFARIKAMGWN